jgi:hypothetical protein
MSEPVLTDVPVPDDTPLIGGPADGTADGTGTAAPIVARAGRYYRNARYLMVVGLVVMGAYFAYDGYKGYPERNRRIDAVNAEVDRAVTDDQRARAVELQRQLGAKKSDTDIGLQKVLGFGLPAVALAYLVYFLRKSRGEVRLENDVLSVPGHPPVPLASVTNVDNRLWKKKGIAHVSYDVAGRRGRLTLDDFVYQQLPVDAIYDRLQARAAG